MTRAPSAFFSLLLFTILIGCGDDSVVGEECVDNSDCAENEFCASGLCPEDQDFSFGVCDVRPDRSECEQDEYDPDEVVCGCDGITYRTGCFADAEGVRIAVELGCPCEDDSDCSDEQDCVDDPADDDVARCAFR